MKKFELPEYGYGAFCNKILLDFILHHKLGALDMPLPDKSSNTGALLLSRIFDIMLHSMGEENRERIIKELESYKLSMHPGLNSPI